MNMLVKSAEINLIDNKIIAGYDPIMEPDDTDSKKESWYRKNSLGSSDWVHISTLQYDSSHDWLNPVAKRVKEELIELGRNYESQYEQTFAFVNMLNGAGASLDITQLFPVVVKSIMFLNAIVFLNEFKKENG